MDGGPEGLAARGRQAGGVCSHGLMIVSPNDSKSLTLRVTMVKPRVKAVAAINTSRSACGSPNSRHADRDTGGCSDPQVDSPVTCSVIDALRYMLVS